MDERNANEIVVEAMSLKEADEDESAGVSLQGDCEDDVKKTKREASLRNYPNSVYFVLGSEFCERFSFYGMRTILTLYLIMEHRMSPSAASSIFHAFVAVAFLTPLLGSILADSWLGRYRVILVGSVVYVFGHGLLSIGAVPYIQGSVRSALDAAGLTTIAVATGAIKPCVSAFAADQFTPRLAPEREQFFSYFYLAINAGSLLAVVTTPILRGRISCLGSTYCFPLAFGVPGVLMLIALVLFVAGTPVYQQRGRPKNSGAVWDTVRCFWLIRSRGTESARRRYGSELVHGVETLSSLAAIFSPVAFFWTLFDQQGSSWVLQASEMNGRLGPIAILPDQMSLFNAFLILVFVPLFETYLYPAIRRSPIRLTPLRKMGTGGLLAALSFLFAAMVQMRIDGIAGKLPSDGSVRVVFADMTNCQNWSLSSQESEYNFSNNGVWNRLQQVDVKPSRYTLIYTGDVDHSCSKKFNGTVVDTTQLNAGRVVVSFDAIADVNGSGTTVKQMSYPLRKTENGNTMVYFVGRSNGSILTASQNGHNLLMASVDETGTGGLLIRPGFIGWDEYDLRIVDRSVSNVTTDALTRLRAGMGASYLVVEDDKGLPMVLGRLIVGNELTILWLIPQYILLTAAEVLMSVTGLELGYTQATAQTRSVVTALWLMTICFGNMIAVAISGSQIVPDLTSQFLLYAALMTVVMAGFVLLARNYRYRRPSVYDAAINGGHDEVADQRTDI